jgi:hypothetical protein
MAAKLSSALPVLSDGKYPLLGLFVVYVLFQQWQSYRRLSQFKGPFWAGLTSLWLARSVSRRRAHLDLYEVHQQYGALIPLPHTVSSER